MTPDYLELPDPEAESTIFRRLNDYDDEERLRYAQIGLMAKVVSKRMLWRHRIDKADGLPCRSFARWVRIACPYSYSTVYAALRDVEELSDVPDEELSQIPQSNFHTMKMLSGGVRKLPGVLEAARTQKNEQFVETIKRSFPDQHLEHSRTLRFTPSESAADKIEEALTRAQWHGATNRNDALELVAAVAMQTWQMEAELEESHVAELG